MFNIEFILKALALVIAIGLLLSSVDFSYLLAKFFVKEAKEDNRLDDSIEVVNESATFLKTLELWYLLKRRCDDAKLSTASKKLDEVFPLLNDNLENN